MCPNQILIRWSLWCYDESMSTQFKFENHVLPETKSTKSKVVFTDLLLRLNTEKKKERNSNIALSIAAVSAIAVFGIILSI